MSLLSILSAQEKKHFQSPPTFNSHQRTVYFSLTPPLKRMVKQMTNTASKVGFVLQLGYFRSHGKFYPIEKFRKRDILYIRTLLRLGDVDLSQYNSTIMTRHRNKILKTLDWTLCDHEARAMLRDVAKRQVCNQVHPRLIFDALIDVCWKHCFVVPSEYDLTEIISDCFNDAESSLLDALDENLSSSQSDTLENLLLPGEKIGSRAQPEITALKKISQSLKPGQIKESIQLAQQFDHLYQSHKSVYDALPLSDAATEYYARWFQKADYQQLNQFPNRNKAYLHLLSFIKHQLFKRSDYFVDIWQRSLSAAKTTIRSKQLEQEQSIRQQQNESIRLLSSSRKVYLDFAKAVIEIVESKRVLVNEKYYKIETLARDLDLLSKEEEGKLDELDHQLDKESRNQSYYDLLEAQSLKLQTRLSEIFKFLSFDRATSEPVMIEAIDHYKMTDGKIGNQAPTAFLSKEELNAVYATGTLNVRLYKALLFFHIGSAIKSVTLNLRYSYRYRAMQNYLIDANYWKQNKARILEQANLTQFADGKAYLRMLKDKLNSKYDEVNQVILQKENPYFRIDQFKRPVIKTPAIELKNKEFITSTLSQSGFVPVLQVLKEANAATRFTQSLKHFSNKHVKMKPSEETLLAGIIAKGCNIGLRKLANISSGVSEHNLYNSVNWFFDAKTTMSDANQKVVKAINGLELANNYLYNHPSVHSSSDGRKVNVAVDSLHANYSFKYFGKDKGVTMYTFVDERQAIFYSSVFSASDREATYVIDGLMHNEAFKEQTHSTDTHGFSSQIFAAAHFIGVDFAPRLKNLARQRIYGFSAKKTYAKKGYPLLPSRTIDTKLILKHWDDILRFMAT
ncbi:MAG: Tn3 family transposase, partial [Gammaproteobacteria bacterium]|nr:Tn3 family transposase [Gammaproteobacteria bacterium]